jgi:hypothetical protein
MRRARLRRRENILKRYLIHVAGPEPSDTGADRLHHARRLVAVDRRQIVAPDAVDVEIVAVADGAGGGADKDLARASIDRGPRRPGTLRLLFAWEPWRFVDALVHRISRTAAKV